MLYSASWRQTDTSLMSMTGQVLMTCDLARRYGLTDVDGMVIDVYDGVLVLPKIHGCTVDVPKSYTVFMIFIFQAAVLWTTPL